MTILRQKDKSFKKDCLRNLPICLFIDKIHSDLPLNVALQSKYNTLLVLILELVVPKKYSLIIYSLKIILYFCFEFKEMRFFLLRFLCVYIY